MSGPAASPGDKRPEAAPGSGAETFAGVSVVIPALNAAHLLDRCLDSVLAQTWPVTEILVVDDGSTDETAAVLAGIGRRSEVPMQVIRQENRGQAAARNRGIRAAGGEWIAFLDADDRWLPEKVEKQLGRAGKDPDAGLIYTDALVFDAEGREQSCWLADKGPISGWAFDRLLQSFFVLPSTVMVRRSWLLQVGLFSETMRHAEDYDLWLRLARVCPFACLTEPLVLYQRQPGSATRQTVPSLQAEVTLFEGVLLQGLASGSQRRSARRRLAGCLFSLAYELRGSDPVQAWQVAWQAVAAHPARLAAWKLLAANGLRRARASGWKGH